MVSYSHRPITLQQMKRLLFSAAQKAHLMRLCGSSKWRQNRLSILCYHGVSIADEHEWRPSLFVRPEFFRRRMALLRDGGFQVLALHEAITLLDAGTLPPRSVVLTFDDGTYDFYSVAWPILREYAYPATVYWSTYYATRPFPVFSVARSYAAWRAGRSLPPEPPDLAAANGAEKDAWLRKQCEVAGVPYSLFDDARILTIMRPAEAASVASEGCDVQLHTHRHRMPLNRAAFIEEIEANRSIITATTGRTATHFCYTSGRFRRRFLPWLKQGGVVSATTTEPGLTSPETERMLMPRLVDHEGLSEVEFLAWVSGLADMLPRRTYWSDPDSLRTRNPSGRFNRSKPNACSYE